MGCFSKSQGFTLVYLPKTQIFSVTSTNLDKTYATAKPSTLKNLHPIKINSTEEIHNTTLTQKYCFTIPILLKKLSHILPNGCRSIETEIILNIKDVSIHFSPKKM